MDRVRVVYATKTKHSKKLAEAIGKELGVDVINAAVCSPIKEMDTLFMVGGIYAGKCNPTLVACAETLDSSVVKQVVLVTSSVSSSQRCQKEIREIIEKKDIKILGEISCPGNFLFVKLGHPNAKDVQHVVSEAKKILDSMRS